MPLRNALVVVTAFVCFTSVEARALTYYAANDCSGQPTPCTTNLQTALDAASYDTVQIVANSTFSADYRINRPMTLNGGTGVLLQRATQRTYTLRVEDTFSVTVSNVAVTGRVAVYNSDTVSLLSVDVSSTDIGVQINDSSNVRCDPCTVSATDRAIDVLDSTAVTIRQGWQDSSGYGVVLSDSAAVITTGDIYGALNALVLQNGNLPAYPSMNATDSTLTASGTNRTTWRWERSTTSYYNCSPTPTELFSESGNLVSLISYDPWGGN